MYVSIAMLINTMSKTLDLIRSSAPHVPLFSLGRQTTFTPPSLDLVRRKFLKLVPTGIWVVGASKTYYAYEGEVVCYPGGGGAKARFYKDPMAKAREPRSESLPKKHAG